MKDPCRYVSYSLKLPKAAVPTGHQRAVEIERDWDSELVDVAGLDDKIRFDCMEGQLVQVGVHDIDAAGEMTLLMLTPTWVAPEPCPGVTGPH